MTTTSAKLNPEPTALVQFRGRSVQVMYSEYVHCKYGRIYIWNFVARRLRDDHITDLEYRAVYGQIRQHDLQRKRADRITGPLRGSGA